MADDRNNVFLRVWRSSSPLLGALVLLWIVTGNLAAASVEHRKNIPRPDTATARHMLEQAVSVKRSSPDTALYLARTSLSLYRQANSHEGMADALFCIGRIQAARYNFDSARWYYRQAVIYYQQENLGEKLADVYNKTGVTYGIQGDYATAADYFRKSAEQNKKVGNFKGLSWNFSNLGNVYKYLGDYPRAIDAYHQSLSYAQQISDTAGIITAYNHLGIMSDYQGDYKRALDYYFQALKLSDIIGDLKESSALNGNIGVVYYYQGLYREALTYHKKQLSLAASSHNERGMGYAYINIGSCYEKLQQWDSALINYRRSLVLREKISDKKGISYCWYNIANINKQLGRMEQAVTLHLKSLGLREAIDFPLGIAESCLALGTCYMEKNDLPRAHNYLRRAWLLGKQLDDPGILQNAARYLSDYYKKVENYRKALEYMTLYKQMSDSLINAENVRKVTTLELEYEFSKQQDSIRQVMARERYISNLKIRQQRLQKNIFIAGMSAILIVVFLLFRIYIIRKRADRQKEMLLREIHHRVKNNLQTISSLLSLQGYTLKDERAKEIMMAGQARVKSMALIHQYLYQHDRLTHIEMQRYFTDLADSLKKLYAFQPVEISMIVRAEGLTLDIDLAIPVGMIVNELIGNACKHAFAGRDKGTITVEITREETNRYLLTVADDGNGFSGDISKEHPETLGLRLVSLLTRQLRGSWEIRNDNGTTVTIRFNGITKKTS